MVQNVTNPISQQFHADKECHEEDTRRGYVVDIFLIRHDE